MAYCVQSLNAGAALDSISAEETHLRVLRLIEVNPEMSQRELAEALGVSLGKTNYCLKALLDRGLIKVQNFRNSKNKAAYAYYLTPEGMRRKAGLTAGFLKRKIAEYQLLKREIELLKAEAGRMTDTET
ncbi:MAG: MarR family EPS-associated transcriptional regulator [Rhodocyclales bacterium]|nr:MarR family EPS-associated transcriptional regulator [Rhodocyclales bacterium]